MATVMLVLIHAFYINLNLEICFAEEIKLPARYIEDEYNKRLGQLSYANKSEVVILFCSIRSLSSIVQTMEREIANFDKLQLIASESIGPSWVFERVFAVKTGFMCMGVMANRVEAFEKYLANLSVEKMENTFWFKLFYEQIMNCTFGNTSGTMKSCNLSKKIGNAFLGNDLYEVADKVIDAVYIFAHGLHKILIETNCSNILFRGCKIPGQELLTVIRNSSFPSADGRTVYMDNKGEVNGGYIFYYATSGEKESTHQLINIGQWQDRLNMSSTLISNLNLFSVKAQCSEQCNDDQIQERIHGKPTCCWTCVKCPEGSIVMNKTSCHACARGFFADTKRGKCVKIPEIYYSLEKRVSKFLVVPPLVFSFLGILGVIFTMCIFIRFNSNPLVKASGRELCYLLLTGLFLSFMFPIVSILRPSRFKCLAQFFLDSLPITISFVPIAVKTNRIFRIFDKNRILNNRPLFMRPLHQIILSFLFIFIQILMLLILVIAQFPEENLVYFSSTEVHLVCSTSKAQIILSHLYNLILIVICTYYAFKTRHVPGPYNEAKVIAFAMYSSCLIIFSFIIMFAVAASRGADRIFQLAIHSYRVVLLASVILLCFFGPKTYLIIFHNGSTPSIWLSSNQDGKTGSTRRRDEAHSR
jgi:hypothetical protein